MAKVPDGDAGFILDIILAARDARSFVGGMDEASFLASRLHQNAVIRSLEVIGEAAGRLSPSLRAAHPEVPWSEIIGMRHRLIHGYESVRLELVWIVVNERLGPLAEALERLVPGEGDTSPAPSADPH
jgi:uncharacterized protein with HEPN domain